MIWILAPFALAFALFVVFLIVSIFLGDPARPFRMFGAPRLDRGQGEGRGAQGEEEGYEEQDR